MTDEQVAVIVAAKALVEDWADPPARAQVISWERIALQLADIPGTGEGRTEVKSVLLASLIAALSNAGVITSAE